MTPKEIRKDIRSAVKQFGEYNFFDKGLYESMDTDKYKSALVAMGAVAAADTLEAVIKLDKKYGPTFVMGMLCCMDDLPEKFFDALLEREGLSKLY
jgi:hypothetical protein